MTAEHTDEKLAREQARLKARAAVKVPAKFAKDESSKAGYLNGAVEPRPIETIAAEIRADWKPVNYAARPYLDAMSGLITMNDSYGADSARSVVSYFLSNASTWRGGVAKHIKAELQAMLDANPSPSTPENLRGAPWA